MPWLSKNRRKNRAGNAAASDAARTRSPQPWARRNRCKESTGEPARLVEVADGRIGIKMGGAAPCPSFERGDTGHHPPPSRAESCSQGPMTPASDDPPYSKPFPSSWTLNDIVVGRNLSQPPQQGKSGIVAFIEDDESGVHGDRSAFVRNNEWCWCPRRDGRPARTAQSHAPLRAGTRGPIR